MLWLTVAKNYPTFFLITICLKIDGYFCVYLKLFNFKLLNSFQGINDLSGEIRERKI